MFSTKTKSLFNKNEVTSTMAANELTNRFFYQSISWQEAKNVEEGVSYWSDIRIDSLRLYLFALSQAIDLLDQVKISTKKIQYPLF